LVLSFEFIGYIADFLEVALKKCDEQRKTAAPKRRRLFH